jgi:hypothetical protein
MNKLLLAGAALLSLPAVVGAQPTAPVQVTVMGQVQLTRTGITDFGTVGTRGETYVINPAAPTGAQQTALFTATGAPLATIAVSWDPTLDLCHETAGCGTKLVFSPNLAATTSQCSSCGPRQDFSITIPSGGSAQLDQWGLHFFFLGGSVTVNASQTPGLYSGMFTLIAEYQ